MSFFESMEEFKKVFKFDEHDEYIEFTPLIDVKIGFSIQREYPEDIKYKPPKTRDGRKDVLSLIHIVYFHP